MRHHVSTNQLVLWPHHELTEAWAPTGIRYPPQTPTVRNDQAAGGGDVDQAEDACEVNRGMAPAPAQPTASVLTRNGGVCGQVGRESQHIRRGRRVSRRALCPSRLDLV
jgi:hypothetical protein